MKLYAPLVTSVSAVNKPQEATPKTNMVAYAMAVLARVFHPPCPNLPSGVARKIARGSHFDWDFHESSFFCTDLFPNTLYSKCIKKYWVPPTILCVQVGASGSSLYYVLAWREPMNRMPPTPSIACPAISGAVVN